MSSTHEYSAVLFDKIRAASIDECADAVMARAEVWSWDTPGQLKITNPPGRVKTITKTANQGLVADRKRF